MPPGLHPLVFIHGAADSAAVWEHQTRYFAARGYPVLGIDLPGHGARLTEPALDRVALSADHVLHLITERGLSGPVLVGHSMGGAIALTIALQHPAVPRALVLAGSGARLRMRPEELAAAEARVAREPPSVRVPRVIEMDRVVSPAASEETRAWLQARFGECTAQATYADFLATHGFDLLGRLEEITQPTLVIAGEDDLWTPPRFQDYFAAHLPNVRLRMLPATGHYPFVERPAEFNAEVEAFLASLD